MKSALSEPLAILALQPLYRAYRRARPRTRAQMRARDEGLRFRRDAESWEPSRRRAWILERLRFVARRAWRETTFYRDLFARVGFDPHADFGFEDFAALPVLEREQVRQAGPAMVSRAVPSHLLRHDATGGSTGTPTQLWKGPEELGWGESASEHYMRRIGLPTGSSIGLLWGHHLDPTARAGLRDRIEDSIQNQRWYDCLRLSPAILREHHAGLEAWRPRGMIAYAGALAALADELRAAGLRPSYPRRAIVTGAEKLHAHQRATVHAVFGRPVHERYGGRDVGLIGFQLAPAESLDFEVDWSNVLVEPEEVGEDGTASILVTKLHADGMPMLRYRVGDLARFARGSAPGEPTFVLHEVLGRETDRIWLPSGGWVNGLEFPHMFKDFPVSDFQVVQDGDYAVRVSLVPAANGALTDEHRRRLAALLGANLPQVSVELTEVESIARGKANKWRPVMSAVAPVRSGAAR